MKNIHKSFLFLMFMTISCQGWAQQLIYEQKYTGNNTLPSSYKHLEDQPIQIFELPDSSILFLGWGQSMDTVGSGGGSVYQDMKKLDKNGNIIWATYMYPGYFPPVNPELDLNSFDVLDNGNILLIGKQAENGLPLYEIIYTLTLGPDGHKISDTTYYQTNPIIFTAGCSSKGPDAILIGGHIWGTNTYDQAYATKIGLNMVKEWEFSLEGTQNLYSSDFGSVIANQDGSFDCLGMYSQSDVGPRGYLFVRLTSTGGISMIKKYYGIDSTTEFKKGCAGPGYRIMMGLWSSQGLGVFLKKVDTDGNELWTYNYPGTQICNLLPEGVNVTKNNDILVTGQSYYYDSINHTPTISKIFVLKVDSLGNTLWYSEYGTDTLVCEEEFCHYVLGRGICQSMDGNYLVGAGDNINYWYGPVLSLLKIGEGYTGVNETTVPQSGLIFSPNPFHNITNAKIPGNSENIGGTLKLFDVSGNLMKYINNPNAGTLTISREGLADGFYFYTYENQQKILYRGKVIAY